MSPAEVPAAVDWDFAATLGGWLARPAPPMTDYTRRQAVGELRDCARAAEPLVRGVTGLVTDAAQPVPEAQVVDRKQWISAAAASLPVMLAGSGQSVGSLGGRMAAAQTGAVLAFVASSILGQYDPFRAQENGGEGTLLLVYPNIVAVERQLRVPPADFRLWVCLHEVTHRVQFSANPWLTGYLSQALTVLTDGDSADFTQVVGRLAGYLTGRRDSDGVRQSGILGLVRAVQSEEQRSALDRLLTLGTLLEGHADHVMDAVGPLAVPSVAVIRERFEQRRQRSQPPLQRLVRALLGLDVKLSQYTRGKAFVDSVVGQVGMERFNTVWSGPQTLPLPAEIEEPRAWIDRVL